jgi:D-3-phosphoglycerate dehydrogenase
MALGLGMKVIASDNYVGKAEIKVDFYNDQFINVEIFTEPIEDLLKHSDFVTLHVPAQKEYIIGAKEFEIMKDGVGLINCSRGGIINEVELIEALDNNKVLFAGLDVFEDEPTPAVQVLMHPQISMTPHIGAATLEAQERISVELAEQIITLLKHEI